MNSQQGATEDELRRLISRAVKLGLGRYLARTPQAARASLSVAAAAADAPTKGPTTDPWNAWVFRIGANINGSREHDFTNNFVYGRVNASRVTDDWKTSVGINENYNDQSFTIGSDKVTSVTRNYGASLQQVKSLGEHWSAGLNAGAASSTYLNQHLGVTISPTVEYDVFPYKDFTRQALTFQYSLGMKHFRYDDTTVYFKKVETLPYQSLNVVLAQKQTWGSIQFAVNGYHYLNDISKSRLTFSPEADVRLFKGFSINVFGNYSVLHDQLYLPKGNLTREEVLLRQSQLATTYRAFIYMGINYTFGSVLNNVVNPRFGSNNNDF